MMNIIGIFLSIVTLLSGSALGFLISQIWFIIFNYIVKMQRITKKRKSYNILMDNFPNFINNKDDLFSLMNYILTSEIKENMTIFVTRKNDLFSSLATTIFSIISGLIIGIGLKKYVFIATSSLGTLVNWPNYYTMFGLSIVTILFLLIMNLIRIWFEIDSMACLLLYSYIEALKSDSIKNDYLKKELHVECAIEESTSR